MGRLFKFWNNFYFGIKNFCLFKVDLFCIKCFILIIVIVEDDVYLEEFFYGWNFGRRIVICLEIEKNKNKFKVNGVWMLLYDMW